MNALLLEAIRTNDRLAIDGEFFRPDPSPALSEAEYSDLCRRVREADRRAAEKPEPAPPVPVGACARPGCGAPLFDRRQRYCSHRCTGMVNAGHLPRGRAPKIVDVGPPRYCPCGEELQRRPGEAAAHFRRRKSCNADCAKIVTRRTVMDRVAAGEWGPARRGARKRAEAPAVFTPSPATRELMERAFGRGRQAGATL